MPIYNSKEYIKIMRPIPSNWPTDIYGIPFVKKSRIDISNLKNGKWLINISNVNNKAKYLENKINHCFKYDGELLRYYNNPFLYLERASKCYASSTLDFSMHPQMKTAQIIEATFKNRWSGVFLQANGVERVAVTVGWVDKDTYDICFAGIYDGTLLIISTLGTNNPESIELFLDGYKELRKRFTNSPIICLGNKIQGMDDDVCYINYKDSFGNFDLYNDFWQPSLINWDNSIAKEVM